MPASVPARMVKALGSICTISARGVKCGNLRRVGEVAGDSVRVDARVVGLAHPPRSPALLLKHGPRPDLLSGLRIQGGGTGPAGVRADTRESAEERVACIRAVPDGCRSNNTLTRTVSGYSVVAWVICTADETPELGEPHRLAKSWSTPIATLVREPMNFDGLGKEAVFVPHGIRFGHVPDLAGQPSWLQARP